MELVFEHYEERQDLCTRMVVPPVQPTPLSVDGTIIGEVGGTQIQLLRYPGPNPAVNGPGPEIIRYQGKDPEEPNYDPARAGDIVDGFDKVAWFRAQTIELKANLVQDVRTQTPVDVPAE